MAILYHIAYSNGFIENNFTSTCVNACHLQRNLLAVVTFAEGKKAREPVEALLELHTDGAYMRDPPALQLWTCMYSATDGGGRSRYVDGLAVAERLQREDPQAYDFFRRTPNAKPTRPTANKDKVAGSGRLVAVAKERLSTSHPSEDGALHATDENDAMPTIPRNPSPIPDR